MESTDDFGAVIDKLAEMAGRMVVVMVSSRTGVGAAAIAVMHGLLGEVKLVGEGVEGQEETRGVAFYAIPTEAGVTGGHGQPGFYLNPAEFEFATFVGEPLNRLEATFQDVQVMVEAD
jgi:hypothetical protein